VVLITLVADLAAASATFKQLSTWLPPLPSG
jgi:hypothetical protein